MDIEKLINLIYGHKCLWDPSNSHYHLRGHQRKSWREISEEMNISEDAVRKKWRGLRDTFGKELKRTTTKKSGRAADTEPDSKWCYFKKLLFLRGTMSRRDRKGKTLKTYGDMDSDEEYGINTSIGSDHPPSPTEPSPGQSSQNSMKTFQSPLKKEVKKQKPDDIDAKLLLIDEEKCFQDRGNDSDAQFLMSLLPFLTDVPKRRKLMVRGKLQQVLIDEQNAR